MAHQIVLPKKVAKHLQEYSSSARTFVLEEGATYPVSKQLLRSKKEILGGWFGLTGQSLPALRAWGVCGLR
jgi:hypothetical protein